jgi:hypothetical protein
MLAGCTGNLTADSSVFKVSNMILNLQIGDEQGRKERTNKRR